VLRPAPEYPRNQANSTRSSGPSEPVAHIASGCGGPTASAVRDAGRGRPVRSLLQCAACGRQTSVTAGTVFQDTRTPLTVWFRAMWAVTEPKSGTSALALQPVLGLSSRRCAPGMSWVERSGRSIFEGASWASRISLTRRPRCPRIHSSSPRPRGALRTTAVAIRLTPSVNAALPAIRRGSPAG
jgi:hypothetical protein